MENEILDSLNDLGYDGPWSNDEVFSRALDGGPKSLEYTKLVHILSEELKQLCNLEETVNLIDNPDESSSFLLELSSFLKELGCPYKKLVTGHMSSRLQSREDRILLLDYLVSELMSARMVKVDCPKEKTATAMEIVMQESPTAKDLKDILITLKFNKPPPNITLEVLFSKLEAKLVEEIAERGGDNLVGKSLYNKSLSDKEWRQLEVNFTELFEEYRLRRETLITRLECTIQSFEWSDRLKTKKDDIQSTYRPKKELMKVKPDVKLSDFLAARTSLLQVEKTSSASVRKNTQSSVNKVIIGHVPDRGGRPQDQQPPPPEMPSWQQRVTAPPTSTQGPIDLSAIRTASDLITGDAHAYLPVALWAAVAAAVAAGRAAGRVAVAAAGAARAAGCKAGITTRRREMPDRKRLQHSVRTSDRTTRRTRYQPAATTKTRAATIKTKAVTRTRAVTIQTRVVTTRTKAVITRTMVVTIRIKDTKAVVDTTKAAATIKVTTRGTSLKVTSVGGTRTSMMTGTGKAAVAEVAVAVAAVAVTGAGGVDTEFMSLVAH